MIIIYLQIVIWFLTFLSKTNNFKTESIFRLSWDDRQETLGNNCMNQQNLRNKVSKLIDCDIHDIF